MAEDFNVRGNDVADSIANGITEKGTELAIAGTAAAIGALVGLVGGPAGSAVGAETGAKAGETAAAGAKTAELASNASGALGASKLGSIGSKVSNAGNWIANQGNKLGSSTVENIGTKIANGGQSIAQKGSDFADWQRNKLGEDNTQLLNDAGNYIGNKANQFANQAVSSANNNKSNVQFDQTDNQFQNNFALNSYADGGVVKKGNVMKNVWSKVDKALPYLDLTNDLEQVGRLFGITEEDRSQSRLNHLVTGENRPASHVVTEALAWNGANVVPEILTGALKAAKTYKAGKKAIEAADKDAFVFDLAAKGIKDLKDENVIKEMSKVGNELTEAGVDAVKSANKGKIVKNSAKGAWNANKKAAQEIMDKANDAITFTKLSNEAEPERVSRFNKEIKPLIMKNPKDRLSEKIANQWDDIGRSSIEHANVRDAEKAGLKGAAITGVTQRALSTPHKLDDGSIVREYVVPLYRKPLVAGEPWVRFANRAINGELSFMDMGWDTDKYPMETVDKLVKEINKDHYFDQDEIDDLAPVEKIWFLQNLAKGKYNVNGIDKAKELQSIYKSMSEYAKTNRTKKGSW